MGEDQVPVLNYGFDRSPLGIDEETGPLEISEQLSEWSQFRQAEVPIGVAIDAMQRPLAQFLGAVQISSTLLAGATSPNVEVHNNQSGWQVVYTPTYLARQIGLGGPSTPVKGYIAPGTYRFGISKGTAPLWDATSWMIPSSTSIFVPLP